MKFTVELLVMVCFVLFSWQENLPKIADELIAMMPGESSDEDW